MTIIFNFKYPMLLASSATVLFTTGLIVYDYFQKKKLEEGSS